MAWIKIDDQFFFRPKILVAGRDGRELYLAGMCYCAQFPGYGIPDAMIRVFSQADDPLQATQALVDAGLWNKVEGGYRILDWLNCSIIPDRTTQEERKCRKYKAWRLAVIRRDEHACQQCGYDGGADHSLHVHHRLPWAAFRRHRFDVDNGLTLCAECHKAVHREMRRDAQ